MRLITNLVLKAFKSLIRFLRKINLFNQPSDWRSLTVLPGIGIKNGELFFNAGFKTPQDVLKASDEELLQIPGVGIGFLKRLRNYR